jgi:hypothetical protein
VSGEPRSYHGQPVLKQPVWKPEVPVYFFCGGLAGASAVLAYADGDTALARRAWATSLGAAAVSAPLLISDLGVRRRFLYMLRVFKVTSPMSVGTWILAAASVNVGVAAVHALSGRLAAPARAARPVAALLGLPLSTYTAVLIAQTAVPVWRDARRMLPFVFAAGAALSAGAAATALAPPSEAGPARRLALAGAVAEVAAMRVMERRLGAIGSPYGEGAAGACKRAAHGLIAAGGLAVATRGRERRPAAVLGGAALLAGGLLERFAVFRAGFPSAADPAATVGPQRERLTPRGLTPHFSR